MMRKQVFVLVTGVCMTITGILCYHVFFQNKEAYVNAGEIFNGFLLKKQLELELKNKMSHTQASLDSMVIQLNGLSQVLNKNPKDKQVAMIFEMKRNEYAQRKDLIEEENNGLTEKYDEQVWTQINQYVKDYGEAHHYDFIYGVTGNGSLMYAKERNNITAEVLEYINKRYEGKN